jgi:hypothetical protein
VLLAGGEALRRTSSADERMATALETLSTTAPGLAAAEFTDMEEALGIVSRVPLVGPAILRDVQYRRAEASYWSGDYAPLTARAVESGGETDDPALRFVSINAMFRELQRRKPNQETPKALDDLLQRYLLVLQDDPGHVDAAYNYELISRIRDAAARGRYGPLQQQADESAQGDQGSPPPDTPSQDFNVIVPLEPDERRDQLDAGSGKAPARKG